MNSQDMPLAELPKWRGRKLYSKLGQSAYEVTRMVSSHDLKDEPNNEAWFMAHISQRGEKRFVASLKSADISDLLSRGVLQEVGEIAQITEAGRAFLKRTLFHQGVHASQHQHRAVQQLNEPTGLREVVVNTKESPLTWLANRKAANGEAMIAPHHLAAGERLRADFEKSHMSSLAHSHWDRAHIAYDRSRSDGALNMSEAMVAAKQRFAGAVEKLGPELSVIAIDVCCEHLGLADIEKRHCLPKRSGKVILRMALNQLARHYGFIGVDRATQQLQQRIRHWGAADYRPSLEDKD